jgi:tRNA G10  N-methylase Trm11
MRWVWSLCVRAVNRLFLKLIENSIFIRSLLEVWYTYYLVDTEKDEKLLLVKKYIYTYVQHVEEIDLSQLEQRAFFGTSTSDNIIIHQKSVDPSRSPFMRERMNVLFEAASFEELKDLASQLTTQEETFKVECLNDIAFGATAKIPHSMRRQLERELALSIPGEPEIDQPENLFVLLTYDGRWYFGTSEKSVSVWRMHMEKPQNYSTALSTRVARAIANIAVPETENVRVIDPCCGIGTVIIEALSMGINIVGRDMSPFVCIGSRKNIAHFGYETTITKGPIQDVTEHYDVAIIDLPYNVFTSASREEQHDIIHHAKRIADRVVIVTIESVDEVITELGMKVLDRGVARKQSFEREILVCE